MLTEEHYDHKGMRQARRKAIEAARKAKQFGLILGTLGRQGNPRILDHLQGIMRQKDMNFTVVRFSQACWFSRSFHSTASKAAAQFPAAIRRMLYSAATLFLFSREQERKHYAFQRQFNEAPSVVPGCPTVLVHPQLFFNLSYSSPSPQLDTRHREAVQAVS